jgi:6-phospho-3-hexuloisomerase
MLTAQPQAPLPQQADLRVYLPAQTMAETEASNSAQAMGSAFEQALWILFDALVPRLQAATGQSADDLRRRHTNLE